VTSVQSIKRTSIAALESLSGQSDLRTLRLQGVCARTRLQLVLALRHAKRHALRTLLERTTLKQRMDETASYEVRELCETDLEHGFPELLAQLTQTGTLPLSFWRERYRLRQQLPGTYVTLVAVESATKRVTATATLLIEYKFTRSCGQAGHIEDVVVDAAHRRRNLGSRLVRELCARARDQFKCYKVTLDCVEENEAFYAKLGLERKGVQMVRYFRI